MTADQEVDYRALLLKYIEHVGDCEGTTFLSHFSRDDSEVIFSNEEWLELERLDDEAQAVSTARFQAAQKRRQQEFAARRAAKDEDD